MLGFVIPDCYYFAGITFVIFAVTWLLEALVAQSRGLKIYDLRESLANACVLFIFSMTVITWSNYFVLGWYMKIAESSPIKLFDGWHYDGFTPSPLWQSVLIFFLDDFCFYWYHRAMHRFPFFWAMHETHHSSKRFNITAAGREPTTAVFVTFIFWIPLVAIGFHPTVVLFQQWLNLSYQLIIHTKMVGRLGPLEWILNTPSHHRVHHAVDPEYRDKNFGGVLIIWDRMFGTYSAESADPNYGVYPPLDSYSPVRITLNGFYQLFQRQKPLARSSPLQPLPIDLYHTHAKPSAREPVKYEHTDRVANDEHQR